jgi:KUP system potassium uptake protein
MSHGVETPYAPASDVDHLVVDHHDVPSKSEQTNDADLHLLSTTKIWPSSTPTEPVPSLKSLARARMNSELDNIKDAVTSEPVRANSVILQSRPSATPVVPSEIRKDWKDISRLSVYALGVIYGDIGTSPLYTFSSIFPNNPPSRDDCIGALSLLIWGLLMTVTFKYVVFILTADYHGEGGSFALYSLIRTCSVEFSKRQMFFFTLLGFIGATMLLGDGIITPAISVLSAISGIAVYSAALNSYVTLISIIILILFFLCQGFGTAKIGALFGPTMGLWFFSLAALGIYNLVLGDATVLAAFSPSYGLKFLFGGGNGGYQSLAAVVLGVTGCEALYADMGHFGKLPVRLTWLIIVLPCLILNYSGQAARCALDPSLIGTVYYSTIPTSLLWPMIILSTVATIIASQAIVSGAFSLIHQAIGMGVFPRVRIYHTNKDVQGQIYIPTVNYALMVAVVAVCIGFQNANNLTIAYGVAVCIVMVISTYFFSCVMYYRWKTAIWKIIIWFLIFGAIDVAFLGANLNKVANGGWFPLFVSAVLTITMLFWHNGQNLLTKALRDEALSDDDVTVALKDSLAVRVSGIGLFFSPDGGTIPPAVTQLINRLHTLPERTVFVYVRFVDAPFVRPNEGLFTSLELEPKAKGVFKAIATFGYAQEEVDATVIAKDILKEIERLESDDIGVFTPAAEGKELKSFDIPLVKSKNLTGTEISYFTSRDTIASKKQYEHVVFQLFHDFLVGAYMVLARNAPDYATYYNIPENELIEVGTRYLV